MNIKELTSEEILLRDFWQIGLNSGSGQFTDMNAIKTKARKRFLKNKK